MILRCFRVFCYLYDCLNQYHPLTDLCPLFLFMYNTLLSACTDILLSMFPEATYYRYDINIVYMKNEVAGIAACSKRPYLTY